MTEDQISIRDSLIRKVAERPLIMGILNTTPDSFSDGGRFESQDIATEHASSMITKGADIIDIGGESTRPGAAPVPENIELQRTIQLITKIYKELKAPISIDTYKSSVAREAVAAGAVIINDVWGGTRDADMMRVMAQSGAVAVLTYNRGNILETGSVVDDMCAFFDARLKEAETLDMPRTNIWLDPGIGFAKTPEQNFEILRNLHTLAGYRLPVLVGLSRKSLIGLTLNIPVEERLAGSIGAHLACIAKGADIIRVHDVEAHRQALTMHEEIFRP